MQKKSSAPPGWTLLASSVVSKHSAKDSQHNDNKNSDHNAAIRFMKRF